MGLDNYPDPPPCLVMEKAGRLKVARTPDGRIDCGKTACPFKSIPHVVGGVFGTYCWLRGKVYDDLVEELTGFSLYEDLSRGISRLFCSAFWSPREILGLPRCWTMMNGELI